MIEPELMNLARLMLQDLILLLWLLLQAHAFLEQHFCFLIEQILIRQNFWTDLKAAFVVLCSH